MNEKSLDSEKFTNNTDLGDLEFRILNFYVTNGKVIKAVFNLNINNITIRGMKLASKNGDLHILSPRISLDKGDSNTDNPGDKSNGRNEILLVTLPPEWRSTVQARAKEMYQSSTYQENT